MSCQSCAMETAAMIVDTRATSGAAVSTGTTSDNSGIAIMALPNPNADRVSGDRKTIAITAKSCGSKGIGDLEDGAFRGDFDCNAAAGPNHSPRARAIKPTVGRTQTSAAKRPPAAGTERTVAKPPGGESGGPAPSR